ncbi:MAG: hypothetical protein DHS20C16_16060 [Phycisphaerae bacterium]|nr:MAG: hypothetical protein DHS20C16_16060 [Phycisphaerae bacterium]
MTQSAPTDTRTANFQPVDRRTNVVAVLVGALLLMLSQSGCLAPGTLKPYATDNGANVKGASGLAGIQTRLRRMVPGDVRDDLYFAMQGRPYDRATLAIALKTSQTLADDLKMRQHDAGQVTEQSRRRSIAWLEASIGRVGQMEKPLPPSLISTNWNQWLADPKNDSSQPASIFAFVDRVRTDGSRSRFGGFDLIISTGQPVYPVVSGAGGLAADGASLQQYATALDIGLILFGGGGAQLASAGASNTRAMSLRDAMTRSSGAGAITDAADGETWGAMIARRALVRGASMQPTYHAIGITTPTGERHSLAKRARAAMWVQAIDGQRLGLVEGWRDARIGGGTAFPSRLTDPDWLEAVAHTAMEIRQHTGQLEPFRYQRKMAVLADASAIDPRNPNTWSAAFVELADALVDWQIPFDVVATNKSGANATYEYKMRFKSGADFSPIGAAQEASKLLSKRAPELREVIFSESGENPAKRLYVRQSADGRRIAVVNLSDEPRNLKMLTSAGKTVSAAYVDQLTGETQRRRLSLESYGVRILKRK